MVGGGGLLILLRRTHPDATLTPPASATPLPAAPAATATRVPAATNAPVAPIAQAGGPKIVTGSVTYTNTFFTSGVAEPEIILEDEGGFVTRNRKFVIPVQSQVIGEITSDFYTSPFTYRLSLPAEPNGTLHDVNHDGKTDPGVMVFAVAYWTNTWGDPLPGTARPGRRRLVLGLCLDSHQRQPRFLSRSVRRQVPGLRAG